MLGCPVENLEFNLWYMRERGWIRRSELGTLAITAEGVDHMNSEHRGRSANRLLVDQRHTA